MTTVPANFYSVSGSNSGILNTILLPQSLGTATSGYLNINNTLRVGYTDGVVGNPPYANSNISIKDRGDGQFRDFYLSNLDLYMNTGNEVVRFIRDDELETILNTDPIIFSNVYISNTANNGIISFVSSHSNIAEEATSGFRTNNGTLQFKNYASTEWSDIGGSVETFASNIQTITSTSNLTIPQNTIGFKIKAIGAGGAGGSANTTIYSQGGGGGAGGCIELGYQASLLSNMFLQVNIGTGTISTGGNTVIYIKNNIADDGTSGNMLCDAYGGSVGQTFDPVGKISLGGVGGSGYISSGLINNGYIIRGQRGHPGFYSETQNDRYYHGGRGGDSMFGSGSSGAYIGANASVAGYGSGGGGGIYYNDGVDDGEYVYSIGGNGIVVVEFYTAIPTTFSSGNATYFHQLRDTDIDTANTTTKPYLKYNGLGNIVNIALDIADDTSPALGGNLDVSSNHIKFTNNYGFLDSTGNLAVKFNGSNSGVNHLLIKARRLDTGTNVAEITSDGVDASSDIYIHPKGSGDLDLETASGGTIYLNTGSLEVNNATGVSFNSGYIKTSLAYYYSNALSTTSGSRTTIPSTSDIIVYQITGNNGRYYTKLDAGVSGQHINFIYETNGVNNAVNMTFINGINGANVGIGTGLTSQMNFSTAGQSTQLVYLAFGGPYDASNIVARSRWQVLNTGCEV